MGTRTRIKIDHAAGQADFILGTDLIGNNTCFTLDILGDIKGDVDSAYEEAYERCYPGLTEKQMREANQKRRLETEALVGHTIVAAKPLQNGDVVLTLSDGRVVVFAAAQDVAVITAESMERVMTESLNTKGNPSDFYTMEPESVVETV